ncbi:MAG: ABC transporter ATP-binding protein, partial [Tumebacillaceae bacterium]
MSEYVIQTWDLTKQYNGKAGCKNISLQVPRGVVFGFLGPNGAGKSTFVRTMLGLLHPTSGRAELLGKLVGDHEARRKVGYLPELFRYQEWLTGRQLLEAHAELVGVPKAQRKQQIDRLIDRVGLTGRDREKIKGYSKGMQQRIGIACALLGDPELIFLDEPTSALDPIGRREVRDLMAELRREGKTVFLNSHLLSEVETVCDHVAIIHKSE